MINLEELFAPYATDGATLEGTRKWLTKKASEAGIDATFVDQIIGETFLEIAAGKIFTDPCECGCGNTDAHNNLEHYMRDKMVSLAAESHKAALELHEKRLNKALAGSLQELTESLLRDHALDLKAWELEKSELLKRIAELEFMPEPVQPPDPEPFAWKKLYWTVVGIAGVLAILEIIRRLLL